MCYQSDLNAAAAARIARISDPVARTRAQLRSEITTLRHELAEILEGTRAYREVEAELERAEGSLASLDMCFA